MKFVKENDKEIVYIAGRDVIRIEKHDLDNELKERKKLTKKDKLKTIATICEILGNG